MPSYHRVSIISAAHRHMIILMLPVLVIVVYLLAYGLGWTAGLLSQNSMDWLAQPSIEELCVACEEI